MTAADLRQRVRDKSVLIFAIVVPLGLMFVFNLAFGGTQDPELEPVTVAASADDADPIAAVLVDALAQVDALDVTVERAEPEQIRALTRSGEAGLGLVVPAGFGQALQRGEATAVEVIEGDGAGLETDVLIAVVHGVVDQLTAGTVAAHAAGSAGLPPAQIGAIAEAVAGDTGGTTLTEGEASSEQLTSSAALVAGQAGLFLLFTVGFGVLGLVAERQQGTMTRLLSMPVRRSSIVTAKGLTSFVLGVVATAVLLAAGAVFFGVGFGSPAAVAVLIVCVVAAATSLMFVIARVARTAEQANILQSILAMVLGVAGGAFFPIAATGLAGQLLDLNPVAAFIRGLGITAGGGGLTEIGVPVAIMLGFAVVCWALSRIVPNRGAAA
ncbi:ABC transporter permease subunit [Georgenia thermotolerans]|uniref:ABC transporter permease subunit n=2 Tax=Georgenia thermotolerans TaxID=527326 RepID=A0A7J5UTJ3_9MICO|nr:ABC transporter permease subunit [Georgenia thermotolerans]